MKGNIYTYIYITNYYMEKESNNFFDCMPAPKLRLSDMLYGGGGGVGAVAGLSSGRRRRRTVGQNIILIIDSGWGC